MYTVVVLAALGSSVDLPDCGHRRHGCCGGDCYGCYGCYGCCGGCHGCWGGCYGGCHGCWGGCHGCWGGCYGGGGGRGGYAWSGNPGTYGYASSNYMPYSNGQPTVSGYYDPRTGTLPTWSTVNKAARQVTSPSDLGGEGVYSDEPSGRTGNSPGSQVQPSGAQPMSRSTMSAPATIVVNLPAGARLTIGGEQTMSASGDRTFVSPPLVPGKTYVYTLKGEFDRNGEKVITSQDVDVRAGQLSRVALQFPTQSTAR
jgi:uncharacterized protein (TIGR03000 family)